MIIGYSLLCTLLVAKTSYHLKWRDLSMDLGRDFKLHVIVEQRIYIMSLSYLSTEAIR